MSEEKYKLQNFVINETFKLDAETPLEQLLAVIKYIEREIIHENNTERLDNIKTHYELIFNDTAKVLKKIQEDNISLETDVGTDAYFKYHSSKRRLDFVTSYLEMLYEEW